MTVPICSPWPARVAVAVACIAAVCAAVWLWICLCTFPLRSWNDVRLAPAFAPGLGLSIYPGSDGPASTWMYGPLPVWLNLPATLATGPGEALLVAGVINVLVTLLPTLAVAWLWPTAPLASPGPAGRIVAATLAIAAMPWATWQYIQADNFAIGCGLVANLLLVRGRAEFARWAAAAFATAALACKQTSLAIPLSQVVWLWLTAGRPSAAVHVGRLVAAGLAWLAVILLVCDPEKLCDTAILTPAGLPWTDHPGRRFMQMLSHFVVHAVVPLAVWLGLRRGRPGGQPAVLLPLVAWLLAWPLGLSSVFKIGGTNNCLQGYPLFLPAGCVVAVAALAQKFGAARAAAAVGAMATAILVGRVATREITIWRPHVEAYDEAVELSRRLPGMLWFPWNPLVTVYSERRLYPVEDGLFVKKVTGRPESMAQTRAHLPPAFCAIVLAGTGSDWGIAPSFLLPPVERVDFEHWRMTRPARSAPAVPWHSRSLPR
jgi:hypothetical protein